MKEIERGVSLAGHMGVLSAHGERRRGIGVLIEQVRTEHPTWSSDRIAAEAKARWQLTQGKPS